MIRYILFLFISCLIVFCFTLFFRLGGHKRVDLEVKQVPVTAALYISHLGPYHKVNSSIVKVEEWALANNIPCLRSFGYYIDDPNTADETRLRSEVGCLLEGISSVSLNKNLPEWLQLKTFSEGSYLVAEFEGAPSIGPLKVYPAVREYLKENKLKQVLPPIEIYSATSDTAAKTEYRFKVEDELK